MALDRASRNGQHRDDRQHNPQHIDITCYLPRPRFFRTTCFGLLTWRGTGNGGGRTGGGLAWSFRLRTIREAMAAT